MIALPFARAPHPLLLDAVVRQALEEDFGRSGDLTSELIIAEDATARAHLIAREAGTISGLIAAEAAFRTMSPSLAFEVRQPDGSRAEAGSTLATVSGPAREILSGERVALNFLGHLSGVATAARALVEAVEGTRARIVDTRKTTPGLRLLEKYAVRCGGALNHRFGLDDAVLIKDNHIAIAGSLREAVARARAGLAHMVRIEVEVDTLEQLEEALSTGVDCILLDNMSPEDLRRAVAMTAGRARLEASGNVTLATVRLVAETGVDYISSGAMTHSAPNLDVALDL